MKENHRHHPLLTELKAHAPFTLFGSLLGVIFMLSLRHVLSGHRGEIMFNIFHPAHVLLSALVTTALFRIHSKKTGFIVLLIVGWVGSVGVATISDSVIPYAGELILGFKVNPHAHGGEHAHEAASINEHERHDDDAADLMHTEDHTKPGIHIGFIESWYIVNPAAILGVLLAMAWPHTKFPHAGHVLLSIWASLSHILIAIGSEVSIGQWVGIFLFLFLAVWLPCCFSDIVFPMLLIKDPSQRPTCCHHH
ncbi:MAG: hypothetical protein JW709_08770 [Sedimentisphaerales bacterium]|nr:hypothetical protein [Sedimentisphaerales bacterium]